MLASRFQVRKRPCLPPRSWEDQSSNACWEKVKEGPEAQSLALLEFVAFSRVVCLHPSGSGFSVLPWVPPPVQPARRLGFSFERPATPKNSSHRVFSHLLRRPLDGCVIPLCYKVCMCHFWTLPHHWHIAASPVYLIHGFRLSSIQRFYMTWWGRWCSVLGHLVVDTANGRGSC